MSPDRSRPCRIAVLTRHDVHMELRHLVAERTDIDLRRAAGRLQTLCGTRNLFHEQRAVRLGEIEELDEMWTARHKDDPGVSHVVHQQNARQHPVGYERRVGDEARMKGEVLHALPSLAERYAAVSPGAGYGTEAEEPDRVFARSGRENHASRIPPGRALHRHIRRSCRTPCPRMQTPGRSCCRSAAGCLSDGCDGTAA